VLLLDALAAGLDGPGLQSWAQALADDALPATTSRSHRCPYALVASHREQVGVDIERVEPFDPAFLESIRTPSEPRRPPLGSAPGAFVSSMWCGKEALAKALGDALADDPRAARRAAVLAVRPRRRLAGVRALGARPACRVAVLARH
jgi:phosphopantetheinyl transferase